MWPRHVKLKQLRVHTEFRVFEGYGTSMTMLHKESTKTLGTCIQLLTWSLLLTIGQFSLVFTALIKGRKWAQNHLLPKQPQHPIHCFFKVSQIIYWSLNFPKRRWLSRPTGLKTLEGGLSKFDRNFLSLQCKDRALYPSNHLHMYLYSWIYLKEFYLYGQKWCWSPYLRDITDFIRKDINAKSMAGFLAKIWRVSRYHDRLPASNPLPHLSLHCKDREFPSYFDVVFCSLFSITESSMLWGIHNEP